MQLTTYLFIVCVATSLGYPLENEEKPDLESNSIQANEALDIKSDEALDIKFDEALIDNESNENLINSESNEALIDSESDEDVINIDLSYLGEDLTRPPSEETGEIIASLPKDSNKNPEELGNYAEGDIRFPNKGKNGLINKAYRWPGGEVPYQIGPNFTSRDLRMIQAAIESYHKFTCIRFRPRTAEDQDFLYVTNERTGCWSSVGRTGGVQQLNLQSPGCLWDVGTPIHEFMHAVGFLHEQSRHERDNFVYIQWANIQPGMQSNFKKESERVENGQGVPYDYGSVMHYSADAFTTNGQPTILPRQAGVTLGQRIGFSTGDIQKINTMYGCM